MVSKDLSLPSEEELTVEDINLSTPSFKAAAFHLGKFCETPSNEFMLCKKEEKDPRKCIESGKVLTACGMDFFRRVKNGCYEEFMQYTNCIDKSSTDLSYRPCRKTQAVYDNCMLEKLEMFRPEYGYFCRAKVHDTDRPRPRGYFTPEFPDAPKEYTFPKDEEIPEARHGSRALFYP